MVFRSLENFPTKMSEIKTWFKKHGWKPCKKTLVKKMEEKVWVKNL